MKALAPVLNFYLVYTSYLNPEGKVDHHACATLRLLITSGHVTVYEWRTGHSPSSVGESDDHIPKMIEMERKEIEAQEANTVEDNQEIDVSSFSLLRVY